MISLGVCIGSSNIGYVQTSLENGTPRILKSGSIIHEGNPERVIKELFTGKEFTGTTRLGVTGRKFRYFLDTPSISEPEAIECAYRSVKDRYPTDLIVSAGAETVMVYSLTKDGRIEDVTTGNKCASGTGEFFLQQLRRMDLAPEDVAGTADVEHPFKVSGRCSVFCKSDCTHALNKGIPKEHVVAGLSEMMASKIFELYARVEQQKRNSHHSSVLLVGGTTRNTLMVDYLRRRIPKLSIPENSVCFEALGASLWALKNEQAEIDDLSRLTPRHRVSFKSHAPLSNALPLVTFKEKERGKAKPGEECILGLDVGSTTTKAVLINSLGDDARILASVYLRTNGNPVEAARNCYRELAGQVPEDIRIVGLGTTGSGRQIAGLHALSPAVINEIIAHAIGAAYYDPGVDTIFEIGGQDAKYTYLTNGVASDYAMNEACSAGTGSFLEEAAKESLSIATEEIGGIALRSANPTNFSDQCAAFINSDIKSAIQEGIPTEDIVAGLVYSICLNYANRVKGARSVGTKVFMQGGVCYNRAVPVAMAALLGKEVIVPPEPGLIGAFGVALDVRNKLRLGILEPGSFDLRRLAGREVLYREPFICAGGREKCDIGCSINRIVIEGKVYPFGGACNRYYNILNKAEDADIASLDLVKKREEMVFHTFGRLGEETAEPGKADVVGINRSLMTNTYFPLYSGFFRTLGYRVICSRAADQEGIERIGSAFCYPVETAHGTFVDLLKQEPDILFLPKVRSVDVERSVNTRTTCPFIHAEPSYLLGTFRDARKRRILEPLLDFAKRLEAQEKAFVAMARELGHTAAEGKRAFRAGLEAQRALKRAFKEEGRKALKAIEENPGEVGIVLFGRPYNAFSSLGNKGIPHKFATRGYRVIPCDFLDYEGEEDPEHIYWANGEINLKAAKLARKNPRLFGAYVTNFSCGPDSFLVGFFRKEMGEKPSLTLELDNHTADVGMDTRIEAFIDIVKSYIKLRETGSVSAGRSASPYRPAKVVIEGKKLVVLDSAGRRHSLSDPRVHLLIPSMMDRASRAMAALFRGAGIRADAVPDPTEVDFRLGQGYTSGKECLPIIITTGSLLRYLRERKDTDELLVYFMPGDSGPCRFGSYYLLLQNMVERMGIPDVAFLNLSQEDGYVGFSTRTTLNLWRIIILTDILEQVYSALLVTARDRESALKTFNDFYDDLLLRIERDPWPRVKRFLSEGSRTLASIPRKAELDSVPTVALINEMYVRRNNYARQRIVERLADKGVVTLVGTLHEWLFYVDHMVRRKLVQNATTANRIRKVVEYLPKRWMEKEIKKIVAGTGLYRLRYADVKRVLDAARGLVPETLICESILVTGTTIAELIEEVDGVISIQPFGCMPGRIAEAILATNLSERKLEKAEHPELVEKVMRDFKKLPFLVIDVDGQVFPPILEAKLEAFLLQVNRIQRARLAAGAAC